MIPDKEELERHNLPPVCRPVTEMEVIEFIGKLKAERDSLTSRVAELEALLAHAKDYEMDSDIREAHYREALERIANVDWRGATSQEAIAREALNG